MTEEERKILEKFAWEIVLHKKIKGFHIDDNYQPFTVGYSDEYLAIDFHQPYNMKNRKGGYYTIELKLRNSNKENKSPYEVGMSVIGVDVQQRLKQLIKENEILKAKNNSKIQVIDELNAQIEKMKCCKNCKHYNCLEKSLGYPCENEIYYRKDCNKWECICD